MELDLRGIPETYALAEGEDALWLLEQRLPGRVLSGKHPAHWFGPVAEWAAELAARSGGSVRGGSWWADEAEAAAALSPEPLRPAVEAALEAVGDLPARRFHGDFQPKNVLLDRAQGVGVLDWEHAYEDGPPGLDLLFLAVMASSERPDGQVLAALALGRDPDWAPLRSYLEHAGAGEAELRSLLLAALAVWAADEQARVGAPGMTRAEPMYRRLLLDLGPSLAA